jgi:hypothetical protein
MYARASHGGENRRSVFMGIESGAECGTQGVEGQLLRNHNGLALTLLCERGDPDAEEALDARTLIAVARNVILKRVLPGQLTVSNSAVCGGGTGAGGHGGGA